MMLTDGRAWSLVDVESWQVDMPGAVNDNCSRSFVEGSLTADCI